MKWGRILFDVDLFTGVSRRAMTFRRKENWQGPRYRRKQAWRRDLLTLTQQLSAIVQCNAPLVTGLERAMQDAPSNALVAVMITLRDDLALGSSLSGAMRKRRGFYPAWFVDLIEAGETTGGLRDALKAASDQLMQTDGILRAVRGWTVYLGTVLLVQLTIGSFLFVYIVPNFIGILSDFDQAPPDWPAAAVEYFPYVKRALTFAVAGVAVVVLGWGMFRYVYGERTSGIKRLVRDVLAYVPGLQHWGARVGLVHVCSVLHRLTRANVPLDKALRDCVQLDVSARIRGALARVTQRVEQGRTLGDALESERLFPRDFVTMCALGEASGRLPDAAAQLSAMYAQQTVNRLRAVVDIAGPIGVLVLGIFAFAIYGGVFSVYLRITEALLSSAF